jgi:hypothetical protein
LKHSDGRSVRVEGRTFTFTAHHNSSEEYQSVLHEHELIRHKEVYLDLDIAMAGIGGDMAWSTQLDEKHKVPTAVYTLNLRFDFS